MLRFAAMNYTPLPSKGLVGMLVQLLWFVAGVLFATIPQFVLWKVAADQYWRSARAHGLSPMHGSHPYAPITQATAVVWGSVSLVIAWACWRRGLRTLAVGLVLPTPLWVLLKFT
jgi:hypothetical protein